MGLIMFDPISLGAASIGVNRVSRVSSPARVSDLSARSRDSEDATFSQGSADEAAGSGRQRRDPVGLKAKAGDSRHGKRHQTDATEEEAPRAKVKFRAPRTDGKFEPIFEAEGRPPVKRGEPILEEQASEKVQEASSREPEEIGSRVDVYA